MERLKQTQSRVRDGFMFLGPRPGHAERIPAALYCLARMPSAGLGGVCPSGSLSLVHPCSSGVGQGVLLTPGASWGRVTLLLSGTEDWHPPFSLK